MVNLSGCGQGIFSIAFLLLNWLTFEITWISLLRNWRWYFHLFLESYNFMNKIITKEELLTKKSPKETDRFPLLICSLLCGKSIYGNLREMVFCKSDKKLILSILWWCKKLFFVKAFTWESFITRILTGKKLYKLLYKGNRNAWLDYYYEAGLGGCGE